MRPHGAASGSPPPPLPKSQKQERGQRRDTFPQTIRWYLLSFLQPTCIAKSGKDRAETAQPLGITEANQDLAGTCSASWKERTESRDPRESFLLIVLSFTMSGALLQLSVLNRVLIILLSNCKKPPLTSFNLKGGLKSSWQRPLQSIHVNQALKAHWGALPLPPSSAQRAQPGQQHLTASPCGLCLKPTQLSRV